MSNAVPGIKIDIPTIKAITAAKNIIMATILIPNGLSIKF